jgi:hypothetical protein
MGQVLLEEDHEEVGKLLEELRAGLRSGTDAETTYGMLDRVWARLAVHIRAEHLCLFPALLRALRAPDDGQHGDIAPHAEAESTVELLRSDHDFFMRELAAAINTLRGLMSHSARHDTEAKMEGVRRAVEAVAARLAEHNALEEERVYSWTKRLMPGEEAQLAVDIRRELTNLPPRFNLE